MSSTSNVTAPPTSDSIAVNTVGDQPTSKDTLGFKPYVTAISEFLKTENTHPPLTLSIEGQWGSGKSSFMMQLQKEIQGPNVRQAFFDNLPKGLGGNGRSIWGALVSIWQRSPNLTVQYNPWRQDKEDAVWATFALSFNKQLREKCGLWRLILGTVILFFKRIKGTGGWLRIILTTVTWFALLLGAFTIAWYAWTHSPAEIEKLVKQWSTSDSKAKNELSGTVKWLLGNGWWGGCGALLIAAWAHARKIAGKALHIELEKYLTKPDYEGHVSFVETFHTDFKKMLAAYAGKRRVYVFIDDLDRCDVPKAAELMQAINLMIGDDPRLVFILGMDREKVAAGIAQKYKDLLAFLPEFAKKADEVTPIDGLYFGYSYLEKFIQLTFRVPGLYGDKAIDSYLGSLAEPIAVQKKGRLRRIWDLLSSIRHSLSQLRKKDTPRSVSEEAESTSNEGKETLPPVEEVDWQRVETKGDSERIRRIVSMVSPLFENNPRRLKQFLNSYRLSLYLASGQGLFDRKGRKSAATHEQLGKFVALIMRCPDLLPLLQKNAKLFEKLNFNDYPDLALRPRWLNQPGVREIWEYGTRADATPFDANIYSLRTLDVSKLLSIIPLAPPPPSRSVNEQPLTEQSASTQSSSAQPKFFFSTFVEMAGQYEDIRLRQEFGPDRTRQMIDVVNNASRLMADVPAQMLPALFSSLTAKDNAGLKLIALILVRVRPNLKFYSFVKRSLNTRNSNSWFEHYHAIMAAGRLAALGNKKVKSEVIVILEKLLPALGVDHDRLVLAKDILSGLKESPGSTQDSSAVSA